MNRLLHAGFSRFIRSKIVWLSLIALLGYEAMALNSAYSDSIRWEQTISVDNIIFMMMMLMGIVASVFCSVFVGTEYSDGTLRNKLVVGRSRSSIYLSNYILCAAGAVGIYLISVAVTAVLGYLLLAPPQIETAVLFQWILVGVMICLSYTAVYNLLSMLIPSKVYGAITCILIGFGFLIVSYYLYMMLGQPEMAQQLAVVDGETVYRTIPNPYFLTELKRTICEFLMDFLPGGQSVQLMQQSVTNPALLIFYSTIIVLISNVAGIIFFRRKDIR